MVVSWPDYGSNNTLQGTELTQGAASTDQTKLTALPYGFAGLWLNLTKSGERGVGKGICESNIP